MAASIVITLNVGGKIFQTCLQTLQKYPDSLLAKMFDRDSQMKPSVKDKDGNWFIDRNPELFSHVLDFYRSDIYPQNMPDPLKQEFKYWGVFKKKEYTKEEEFAREFAKHIFPSIKAWLNQYQLKRSDINGSWSRYSFIVPLGVCKHWARDLIDDDNSDDSDDNDDGYPTVKEFKNFIKLTHEEIKNSLCPFTFVTAIILESFNLVYGTEKYKEYKIKQQFTKDEIKIIWDNICKLEDYVANFNLSTCDMICKYLHKKLNTRVKINWKTLVCDSASTSYYSSIFTLPIFKLSPTDNFRYHNITFTSKLLVFEIEHDKKGGYGYNTETSVKSTDNGLIENDQDKSVKKRKYY